MGYVPNLKKKYKEEVIPELMKKFKYKNPMQAPRLEKIVVNCGAGEIARDSKLMDIIMNDLAIITGQKPQIRRAKKSVSNFKIRKGMPVGLRVTLRGDRMYEFLERLISVAIPRIRDFRGLSPDSFDGRGNYTFGVTEQLIFPEIEYDKVQSVFGMDITLVTTAKTDEEGRELLKLLGMPFKRTEGR
ncbi:50S ribosomal protein L5 [bacterium]|uniref:Large ribosomal subunit protein uL5 n=1 Tax=candidate division WOR-3 bacterium TaxID=2052148 RepID=A0A7C0Z8W9_UNCW3|nr:MAG: 50S ribosomal protein L5 [bacterium]RKZ22478.1 MAG: 50S ribosomal protein L5 [bacterium]HDI82390.1 50S ribosomal protein L5 [candidate division WOR-3 bacterium]